MNDREQMLADFIWDNGIKCETCKWWNVNFGKKNVIENVCINEENRQSGAYSGSLIALQPIGKGMCHKWQEVTK